MHLITPKDSISFRYILSGTNFCYRAEVVTTRGLTATGSPSGIPIIGNVHLLSKGAAKSFNSGKLSGCVVNDDKGETILTQ